MKKPQGAQRRVSSDVVICWLMLLSMCRAARTAGRERSRGNQRVLRQQGIVKQYAGVCLILSRLLYTIAGGFCGGGGPGLFILNPIGIGA